MRSLEKKENNENEITIEENIKIFKKINSNINVDEYQLKFDIDNIYNEYQKIENDCNYTPDISNPYQNQTEDESKIDYFLIAKMIYVNKKYFNIIPRKIQILSLIYFIKKNKKCGLIQQINTGEGKSIIIAFLATYIAIKKKKNIDILTSSPVLAKRDALLFKDFYNEFNLKVDYAYDHNKETEKNNYHYTNNPYNCYKADIVYGDTLSFEGDILRTYFMGIMGRGKERKFDCIIIDEIDNIALDNLKNTTELLDCFHGYKFLEYVYLFISKKLKEIVDKMDKNKILDEKDSIIEKLKEESLKEFKDLETLKKKKSVIIPKHLGNYILKRLSDWCESAFIAKFIYHENENYVKRYDNEYKINSINPIDFYNTGVTQENSVWAGLHQFLQIIEKLMITEENLSSCYMSNLTFFKKYQQMNENNDIIENNIYGLTGTIGSEFNKTTLKELYELNTLIIPPFKESKLIIEKSDIIPINQNMKMNKDNRPKKIKNKSKNYNFEEKWFKNIENKIIEIIEKNRSVLVIFRYISEAVKMSKRLKNREKKISENIILYLRSDNKEDSFLKDYIEPRKIILSTNLSGRGTDLKISPELNEKGGLHVILTYEPFNKRIERQAFGRAGRKGENGSAGKIIILHMTEEEAINEINKREEEESKFLINVYIHKINTFEKIFNKFSDFLSEIYERTHDEILLLDLKERWGIFLIEHELNNIERKYKKNHKSINKETFDEIEKEYEIFEKELKNYNYEYDYIITDISDIKRIFEKGKKIYDSLKKDKYEFLNGLYLNKSKDINKVKKGIKKCPELALGGYMFKIIENLKILSEIAKNEKSAKKEREKKTLEIEGDFFILINNLQKLKKQFQTYVKIIGFLGYNKNEYDLAQQNRQKVQVMEKILELMEYNKNIFNENKDIPNMIEIKKYCLKQLFKEKNLKVNGLVLEYFREYGLNLFVFKKKVNKEDNDNCYIY